MKRAYKPALALLAVAALVSGCAGGRRVEVDSEDPFLSMTNSKDFQDCVSNMARSLVQAEQISKAGKPPTIAFAELRNMTNEPIETSLYLDKIRTLIMKNAGGKVAFLNRQLSEAILRERDLKRKGQVTTSGQKAVLGADYFLSGTIQTMDRTDGSNRSVYTRFEFNLTDAESTQLLWADEFEVKKIGKRGLWER